MTDIDALKQANAKRWADAKLTGKFNLAARSLVASKARYQEVESKTGVPWWIIAVIHEREASQNWNTQLGQGDPLNKISVHVPKGRGPFKTWEDGAVDALVNCAPYAAKWKDWSVGGALTLLEMYNGLGYANKGKPSPYIWAGTNQYTSGKYIRDGVYAPNTVDSQPGCAGLLMTMMALDLSIKFSDSVQVPTPPAITLPPPGSTRPNLAPTFWGRVADLFKPKRS